MTLTHSAQHRERVPAEHRVLGLDRRTLPPALFVIAVFFVFTVIVPRVDAAIRWDDPVIAGEQLALTDTIVVTPTSGWDVETGFRVGEDQKAGEATIAGDGVTFHVTPDSFDGTPTELLDQTEKVTSRTTDPTFRVDGDRTTLTTTSGETGVVQPYSSVRSDGIVAAFVIDGTGLKVTAYGGPTQMSAAADDIRDMILSIQTVDGNAS
ncbi:hypothetical protein [Rhodococcoides kyotonense]|uniref:Uncharacterized protein n=1 Tax=Rhodococcoides kyotonense TaxID=398843 RepID=A0A239IQN5_9NOCA|nr:hypothetical protein [Rhodococcus kyotonensis]SNS95373.1 hypothetical protein SAMN05421642_107153 [Rhodococcus kyotonensis]